MKYSARDTVSSSLTFPKRAFKPPFHHYLRSVVEMLKEVEKLQTTCANTPAISIRETYTKEDVVSTYEPGRLPLPAPEDLHHW